MTLNELIPFAERQTISFKKIKIYFVTENVLQLILKNPDNLSIGVI